MKDVLFGLYVGWSKFSHKASSNSIFHLVVFGFTFIWLEFTLYEIINLYTQMPMNGMWSPKKFTNFLNIECYSIWSMIYGSLFYHVKFCIVMKIWGGKSQIQWWFEKIAPSPPPLPKKDVYFFILFLSYFSITKLDKISLWMIASLATSQNWAKRKKVKKTTPTW